MGSLEPFPFSALVGQEAMREALQIAAVNPKIGGVLLMGDRGTGKSTIVRALAGLLPQQKIMAACAYACEPGLCAGVCDGLQDQKAPKTLTRRLPVVDLPLGVTEDRVVGALDIERALVAGEKRFEPGLLAKANGGFLYIDEVNLLEDHIVDLLLDVAASGENIVEREGLSIRHPARFVLIGSGNPEEGELRPQMLDRFGISVEVKTPKDIKDRVEIIRRREAYEQDPGAFLADYAGKQKAARARVAKAKKLLPDVIVQDEVLSAMACLCTALGTDGLRGELTLSRAASAHAALKGRQVVTIADVKAVAGICLSHRLRRDPLDSSSGTARVTRAVEDVLG